MLGNVAVRQHYSARKTTPANGKNDGGQGLRILPVPAQVDRSLCSDLPLLMEK